jgi:ATP-dependent DNA helicase RecG
MPIKDHIVKTAILCKYGGGKIIVGISDDSKIIELTIWITQQMDRISNILHDKIQPTIVPDIYAYNIDEKVVLVIEVYPVR